jgi:cytochrome P450
VSDSATGRRINPRQPRNPHFQDPLAYFARLREERPVSEVELPGLGRTWLITRYDEARAALADPRLAKDPRKLYPGWEPPPMAAMLSLHMLNLDPPDHTRLRRLVQRAFTARRVEALRPRVEEVAAALVDAMAAIAARSPGGVVDLLDQFAFRLPITVICELLGVPARDQDDFREWTSVIVSSEQDRDAFQRAGGAMVAYFSALIAAKRAAPAGDLLSALIAIGADAPAPGPGDQPDGQPGGPGEGLTGPELYAMLFLLLVAGFETTVNLIASGTLALLAFPAEMERLRADPALLPSAVEELLRYANPLTHATERFTVADLPVGDVVIPAGEWVTIVLSAANRDSRRFPDADRLDLSRDATGHVAFGHGIHHCLGAPLARLEGEIAFRALLARFGSITLAVPPDELRWRPSSLIHGLESLPVRLS